MVFSLHFVVTMLGFQPWMIRFCVVVVLLVWPFQLPYVFKESRCLIIHFLWAACVPGA